MIMVVPLNYSTPIFRDLVKCIMKFFLQILSFERYVLNVNQLDEETSVWKNFHDF